MRRFLPLLLGLAAACEPLTGPDSGKSPYGDNTGDGSPILAPIDPAYVPLVAGDTSFWAVKGQPLDVVVRFQPVQPGATGDRLIEFQLGAESLLRSPDGVLLQDGDSVRITIHPDGQKMSFDFEPSGLTFDPASPALMRMWCTHAAADLNGDGTVDGTDERLWYQMRIWKRESASDPWSAQETTRSPDGEELEAPVDGFTGFSVAS